MRTSVSIRVKDMTGYTRYRLMIRNTRGQFVHFATVDGRTLKEARSDALYNHGGYMKGRDWYLEEDQCAP